MYELILMFLVLAVAGLAIVVVRRPAAFCITRSMAMAAPASAVFAQVNDLKNWDAWSPWAKLDPAATNAFEGPQSGVGAIMRWSGNHKVGVGSMTITESRPDELVRFKLEFLQPFKATNTSEFTFKLEGEQTVVTWSMSGTNNLIGKVMDVVMNCDRMVGAQFEQGLAAIKAIVEERQ